MSPRPKMGTVLGLWRKDAARVEEIYYLGNSYTHRVGTHALNRVNPGSGRDLATR
jgi:hypothetical protein